MIRIFILLSAVSMLWFKAGHVSAQETGIEVIAQSHNIQSDTIYEYEYLRAVVESEGEKSDPLVVSKYFVNVCNYVRDKRFVQDSAFEVYLRLSELVDNASIAIKRDTALMAKWVAVRSVLETNFEPFGTCDQLDENYLGKFKLAPNDTLLLRKIARLYGRKDCNESELFFLAVKNLYTTKPTGLTAYLMGKLSLAKGDVTKAETYFVEAVPNLDNILKAKTCFNLAKINFDQKRYNEARSYALKALAITPNDGNCYLLIGHMYALSAKSCGTDEIGSISGYWAAIDKFIQARDVDPSTKDEAYKSIALYSAYLPTREKLFSNGIKEGSSYDVGCWIRETTTVRASN